MSEHTPGPWRVDQYRNHYVVMTADHHLIATVRSPLEANARLIAAAPDLLAAIINLLEVHDRCACDDCSAAELMTEQAIAKAEWR